MLPDNSYLQALSSKGKVLTVSLVEFPLGLSFWGKAQESKITPKMSRGSLDGTR